jgi:hypothetical protein
MTTDAIAIQVDSVYRRKKYKVTAAQQKHAAIKAPPTYGAAIAIEKLVPRTCRRRKNSPSVLTTIRN